MKIALAAASCAIVVGTVGAQVVVFENVDNEFTWYRASESLNLPGNAFDVTMGPDQPITLQPAADRAIWWNSRSKTSSSDYSFEGFNSRVARGPSQTEPFMMTGGQFTFAGLPSLSIGDVVGPGNEFGHPPGAHLQQVARHLVLDTLFFDFRDVEFIGVRVEIDSNTHYGWIQLGDTFSTLSPFTDPSGEPMNTIAMHPVRWAYEQQPDTPIEIAPTCRPDLNGDGVVDADDFFLFLQLFAAGDPQADFNSDGVIDADDFFAFLNAFAVGCD